ncbi:hypothetical protein ANK1_0463 [plant metagenome]|uniref:Uncharacterized protein n=1 Tax=plant metagenome TaxID=1297885 RepID=A0A484SZP6_9ZZZZ
MCNTKAGANHPAPALFISGRHVQLSVHVISIFVLVYCVEDEQLIVIQCRYHY